MSSRAAELQSIGEVITTLRDEFPELAERMALRTPSEKDKRHGQAIAAASLPAIVQREEEGR